MNGLDASVDSARERLGLVIDQRLDDDHVLDRFARVIWGMVAEPGDRVAGAVISAFGAREALGRLDANDLGHAALSSAELTAARERWMPRLRAIQVDTVLTVARRARMRLLVPGDEGWPSSVDDLGLHGPVCLWVRGTTEVWRGTRSAAAVVGARAATTYGTHVGAEFAAELGGGGVTIVSGAAFGIDAAAHRGALAADGATIAVLAGGLDRPYPSAHAELIERIAATGAVIAEVPPGAAPTKWRFLQRNRLIAALGQGTVVVEAGWRSGSLNTAHHAAALGRPLGAVPGPVTSGASAGCHRLIRELEATCVTCVDDIRELIGVRELGSMGAEERLFTDDQTRVLDALSTRTPRSTADIARRAGMSVDDVRSRLGMLSLAGRVRGDESGWRRVGS